MKHGPLAIHNIAYVCVNHFADIDFKSRTKFKLKDHVVPTKFMPKSISNVKMEQYKILYSENLGNFWFQAVEGIYCSTL